MRGREQACSDGPSLPRLIRMLESARGLRAASRWIFGIQRGGKENRTPVYRVRVCWGAMGGKGYSVSSESLPSSDGLSPPLPPLNPAPTQPAQKVG